MNSKYQKSSEKIFRPPPHALLREVADVIRSDSSTAIVALHKVGMQVVMATGDAHRVVRNLAEKLGVGEAQSELLAAHKLELVQNLQAANKTVVITGRVNYTSVLVAAVSGVAMGIANLQQPLKLELSTSLGIDSPA